MTETATANRRIRPSAGDVLGVAIEAQTYRNLLYLVLAFPLGMIYFSTLLFGFIFGLLLSVAVVGVGILVATVLGARLLAQFERWLANALLPVDLREPTDVRPASGTIGSVRTRLDAPSTWRDLGFLALKFWVGILGILLFAFVLSAIELVTAPLRYPFAVELGTYNGEDVALSITSLPEALLAVPVGLLVGLVLLHLANGLAHLAGRMAVALLDGGDRQQASTVSTAPTAPAED